IAPHLSSALARKLQQVFGSNPIAVWGSRDSPANRVKFDRMADGDEILIVEGETIKLLGRIAGKLISPSLSAELWKNIRGDTTEGWNLIYFIANPEKTVFRSQDFFGLFDWEGTFRFGVLTVFLKNVLKTFYVKFVVLI